MFLFTMKATPKPENKEYKDAGEVDVDVWIDFKEQEGAEKLARYYVGRSGWNALKNESDEIFIVKEEDIKEGNRDLEFFKEAQEHGLSIVFNHGSEGEDYVEEESQHS